LKGYSARQLRKEFPDKGWTKSSINRLLKKFRDRQSGQTSEKWQTAKCPHRWKHWPGDDMVLSQEDQPRTHSTVREISRGTGIPKSSVVRIIKKASAAEMLQEATYVRKSWLRRTGPLAWRVLRYLWRRFSSLL